MTQASADIEAGKKTVTVSVDLRKVSRVGAKPPLLDYLVSLWDYRHFMAYDAKARVQTGNSRDRLGSAWLLLDPLLNGLAYFAIFGLLLGAGRGIENFIGYLIIGIFLFQMSSRAILNGAKVIRTNRNVIQAFSFPRATLAVAVNIRELLANIPVLIMMFLLVIILAPTEEITWRWLLVLPAVLLQVLFNLGAGLILAPMVAKVNDLVHVLSFGMRFWMFTSCVMFSIERYNSVPWLKSMVEANPLYLLLSIVRDSVLYASTPAWQSWAGLAAWALGALIVGVVFFWKREESYAGND
ncbi:ABC transporter permease [Arthrobacter sp. zg-Y411]|uniref:ABC transporter permease n=1 Tax=Arthrobacter TaxID=1663 RepID=UPI001D149EA0|nr:MULTISPECIES: ABC transporter permease [Arthrobacter]MCC3293028.1 ABC transporter permease [Arthrobacter zhangbolii]MDN3904196.1 ABC transporter permease [Arthrobacter sp. YD2]